MTVRQQQQHLILLYRVAKVYINCAKIQRFWRRKSVLNTTKKIIAVFCDRGPTIERVKSIR